MNVRNEAKSDSQASPMACANHRAQGRQRHGPRRRPFVRNKPNSRVPDERTGPPFSRKRLAASLQTGLLRQTNPIGTEMNQSQVSCGKRVMRDSGQDELGKTKPIWSYDEAGHGGGQGIDQSRSGRPWYSWAGRPCYGTPRGVNTNRASAPNEPNLRVGDVEDKCRADKELQPVGPSGDPGKTKPKDSSR